MTTEKPTTKLTAAQKRMVTQLGLHTVLYLMPGSPASDKATMMALRGKGLVATDLANPKAHRLTATGRDTFKAMDEGSK